MNHATTPTSSGNTVLRNFLEGNETIFPQQLDSQFPHILEMIGTLWQEPVQAKAYFQELLTTQREHRQGFPPEVHAEIFTLSNFYDKCHPTADKLDDFWSAVADSRW